EDTLGPRQIVMQEPRLGEGAADVTKKAHHLAIVDSSPRRQRDLEHTESEIVSESQPLAHRGGGKSDRADLRKHAFAGGLFAENRDDTFEPRAIDGVSLARGAEYVEIAEAAAESHPNLLAEQVLHQLFVLVPRNLATDKNGLVVAHVYD